MACIFTNFLQHCIDVVPKLLPVPFGDRAIKSKSRRTRISFIRDPTHISISIIFNVRSVTFNVVHITTSIVHRGGIIDISVGILNIFVLLNMLRVLAQDILPELLLQLSHIDFEFSLDILSNIWIEQGDEVGGEEILKSDFFIVTDSNQESTKTAALIQ